jgi:hypothetical protein
MQAAVSQRGLEVSERGGLARGRKGREGREGPRGTHFFWLSVFTCMGVPLRDGRKPWAGRAVSLDV